MIYDSGDCVSLLAERGNIFAARAALSGWLINILLPLLVLSLSLLLDARWFPGYIMLAL